MVVAQSNPNEDADVGEYRQREYRGVDIGLTEARRSFDKQAATLQSIDELAVGTLRIAIVILGLLASTVALGGPTQLLRLEVVTAVLLVAGALQLVLSMVFATLAYGQDVYAIGIGARDIPDDGLEALYAWYDTPEQVRLDVLSAYLGRIRKMEEIIGHQADLLQLCLATLVMGTVGLLYAAVALVLSRGPGFPALAQFLYGISYLGLYLVAIGVAGRFSPPEP